MRHDGLDRRAPTDPGPTPRPPPRDELKRLWRITLGATALLILIVVVIACGNGGGEAPPTPIENGPGSPPADPSACGTGLAAVDLAGNCRAQPNPTSGALEAVN
jgi:hypothetical protein